MSLGHPKLESCDKCLFVMHAGKPATQLVPLLEALLQHGASVDAADEQGTTALHQAAKSSPCAVVEALLAHHAAINQQDKVPVGRRVYANIPACMQAGLCCRCVTEHG